MSLSLFTYDDGVTQLFDLEDMTNFVVRRKHGTIVRSEIEVAKLLDMD